MGRTRQYKKLLTEFRHLGFREPYQILVTADVIEEAFKLPFVRLLEKAVGSKELRILITQCSIRKLYAKNTTNRDQNVLRAIELAKSFERRRCGHLNDSDPLPEHDCVLSCCPADNKHKYFVCSNSEELRVRLRSMIAPLLYIKRSVLVFEPISDAASRARLKDEKAKAGLITRPPKRKRDEDEAEAEAEEAGSASENGAGAGPPGTTPDKKKTKKSYGKKGPNPLSVKKPKKQIDGGARRHANSKPEESIETKPKRKRRRKAPTGDGEETTTEEAAL